MKFTNAKHAFEHMYHKIMFQGVDFQDTKALFNIGFYMLKPLDNQILTPWRNWKKEYAQLEWEWYLSANPNAEEISKHASIWKKCMDDNGNVNSNYGYQWKRKDQLQKIINELKNNPSSRRALISIYDGKEIDLYSRDTPCTQGIQFYIHNNKLQMTVLMRSCDLVFGFCNDQYCFSKLQEMVAKELGLEVGKYYHFCTNLHIYQRHFNLNQ